MDARLAASHDLVLGLLAARPTPSVLFAPDGRVVASTTPDDEVTSAKAALRDFQRDEARKSGEFEVRELFSGARPVGWLVVRPATENAT